MFPKIEWHLYYKKDATGSTQFDEKLTGLANVTIHDESFTDEIARGYKNNEKLVFISDVRGSGKQGEGTGEDGNNETPELAEVVLRRNMADQADWVRTMRPIVSMLKFRLPWPVIDPAHPDLAEDDNENQSKYFPGERMLQPWARQTTTETRLIVPRANIDESQTYNHVVYEQQMMYHNFIGRPTLYDHTVKGVPGLDHCFDCSSEVDILREYLKKYKKPSTDQNVATLSRSITKDLTAGDLTTKRDGDDKSQVIAPVRQGITLPTNLSTLRPEERAELGLEEEEVPAVTNLPDEDEDAGTVAEEEMPETVEIPERLGDVEAEEVELEEHGASSDESEEDEL
jgi:hypothetical protein